jgi:hypothetical protein
MGIALKGIDHLANSPAKISLKAKHSKVFRGLGVVEVVGSNPAAPIEFQGLGKERFRPLPSPWFCLLRSVGEIFG